MRSWIVERQAQPIVVRTGSWLGWDWSAIGAVAQVVAVVLTIVVLVVAIRTLQQALDGSDADRERRLIDELLEIRVGLSPGSVVSGGMVTSSFTIDNRTTRVYEAIEVDLIDLAPTGDRTVGHKNFPVLSPWPPTPPPSGDFKTEPISHELRLDVTLTDRVAGYTWQKRTDSQVFMLKAPTRRQGLLRRTKPRDLPVRVR